VTAYGFIRESRGQHGVKQMAAFLGASRSAYYKWDRHGNCDRRRDSDTKLLGLIRAISDRQKGRYGSPRIRLELARRERGRQAGGVPDARKRHLCPQAPSHGMPACRNVLNRDFRARKQVGFGSCAPCPDRYT